MGMQEHDRQFLAAPLVAQQGRILTVVALDLFVDQVVLDVGRIGQLAADDRVDGPADDLAIFGQRRRIAGTSAASWARYPR